MPSAFWSWGLVGVITVFGAAACSKTNNVSQNKTLAAGEQCDEREDDACGSGAVCALGFCRHGCATDLECQKGAICVGDQAPFGCSLPSELSCSSAQPCESPGLSCSLDGVCRTPCQTANDCPRNEHECILGACVTKNDPGWQTLTDAALAMCGDTTSERCEGSSYQKCEAGAAGWKEISNCGADACTLPGGRCLEQLAEVDDAPIEGTNFSLFDGQLYWLGSSVSDSANLYTIAPTPGSTASLVTPVRNLAGATLSGGLVATITPELRVEMYRVSDGTPVVSVPLLFGDSPMVPPPPLPTSDGVFWFETKIEPEPSTTLAFAALDADAGQVVATIPGALSFASVSRFCGNAELLYFTDTYGTLYRATPGGVETLMGLVDALACRTNDVLVGTNSGLLSLKPDGTQKKLLDFRFRDLQVLGNKVIGNSSTTNYQLWVGDLATGTTEPVFTLLPQHVVTAPVVVDQDYVYFFGVDQKTLVRSSWH
ncbi:MAG TPA: hypothetical protein VHP33_25310 [Polyangiaceae bacterium]|nr:hypothetical protein [Polyangiaceae bacterium]